MSRRALEWLVTLALIACVTLARATPPTPATEEIWLAVLINDQPTEQATLVLKSPDARLWVSGSDLKKWRLSVPQVAAPLTASGEQFYPLDALVGLRYRIDTQQQALIVTAPARLFDTAEIRGSVLQYHTPTASPPGAYLNYDVVVQDAASRTTLGGLLQASAFGPWGSGTSSFVKTDVTGSSRIVRLDTTWVHDDPASITSLRFGDAITGASQEWGGAVRFAGIQWATDFATRPGLVTMPLPTLAGEAALPSTLDLYVNGALRMRDDAPMGPFTIGDVPALTGSGEIAVVVRDLLGREQVVTQSFYASPELLRPGLRDFSLELGVVRNDYGLASNDYGQALLVGTDRVGITDDLTAEIHGEALKDQQTLGVSGAWIAPLGGVLSGAVAGSHSLQGDGALWVIGLQRTASRLSLGVNFQLADAHFARLGILPGETVPRRQIQGDASIALGRLGSLGFIGTRQEFADSPAIELASLRHNVEVGRFGFLSLAVTRTRAAQSDTAFELNFTHTLGSRTSSSLSAVSQAGVQQVVAQVQRNLPAGDGFGYRVAAGAGGTADREATFNLQNSVGTYTLDAETYGGSTRTEASASGGVTLFAGEVFPSRQITGSFAVAEVEGQPGVRVYAENQLVGRTDSSGRILLPDLRPYQDNRVSIDQSDLPLDAQITGVETNAVPYLNGGTLLRFAVVHPHGALIQINLESGEPLPPGVLVQLVGQEQAFPSGLDGSVYVTGLEATNTLHLTWGDRSCDVSVPFELSDADPMQTLGPYVCKESGNAHP